jgi:hypothetical protein
MNAKIGLEQIFKSQVIVSTVHQRQILKGQGPGRVNQTNNNQNNSDLNMPNHEETPTQ